MLRRTIALNAVAMAMAAGGVARADVLNDDTILEQGAPRADAEADDAPNDSDTITPNDSDTSEPGPNDSDTSEPSESDVTPVGNPSETSADDGAGTSKEISPETGDKEHSSTDIIAENETGEARKSPGEDALWFGHAGLGFRAGASFRETATGTGFPAGYVLGPELYLAVWSYWIHRAIVGAGYLYLDDTREKGTKQIRVSSRFHRIDMFAGYEIAWKLLTAGVRVGTALTVVSVETEYGEPTWEVVGFGDEAELIVHDPPDPEVSEKHGTSAGFLGGLGVGLAVGEFLFGIDDLIEIRAQADYVRRDERDEFAVYGLLVFWPTRLLR